MIQLSMKNNFKALETTMAALARDLPTKAARVALTRTVAMARVDVMAEMRKVFVEPTPFTMNAIRYEMATRDSPEAKVFVSDDAAKGLSPRKYLLAEMEGGMRGMKRSERALVSSGLMSASQRLMPGHGLDLNQFGNIPGPRMVQILSKLAAFGQQGYRANVSDKTKKRLKRAKLAAGRMANSPNGARQYGGTDIFVGHSKRGGEAIGVYQLVGRGEVKPILAFVDKAPVYKKRFDFHGTVAKSAAANWPGEMMKAMDALLNRKL